MRTVITGGAGFIGSHLCDRLLAMGHDVLAIDNLITGSADNIAHLAANPSFRFLQHDVTQYILVDGPVDHVLHFASPASPRDYLEFPIQTLKVGSLGTHNALGLAKAKKATFLLASTSEVYGDPLQHPQNESYWGNVNPVGPRGVYDEAKRFAEAIVMAYHRVHGVDTKIARIFNSVLADQPVVLFNDDEMHVESIETYAESVALSPRKPRRVLVPAFDPETRRIELRPADALIRCRASSDAFEISLRYGRSVKVTGDHSLFVMGADGSPTAKPVRHIRPGEYVAIPSRLPVVERDRTEIDFAREFSASVRTRQELWDWSVSSPSLAEAIETRKEEVTAFLHASGRFRPGKNHRNTLGCVVRKWRKGAGVPLAVVDQFHIPISADARIAPNGGSNRWIPNRVPITEDLLWLIGFYLAEGSGHSGEGVHFISFSSDEVYLQRAKTILRKGFGVRVGYTPPSKLRAPSVYTHSKALYHLFDRVLGLRAHRIPPWILQLPLSRLKHVLEGYRCGDGTHSGKSLGKRLAFATSSREFALDLNWLLLRFGIVSSFGRYETTCRPRCGDRRFPFYLLTVCSLDTFDVLQWDRGVHQKLNARRTGDLVWARVKRVRRCVLTGSVYDFSVPGHENFVAGNGVSCHNTYGPRMRLHDGRALPNFFAQALRGEDLTVCGDGAQTRSFCFVSDLVEGLVTLLRTDFHDPVNIGNDEEISLLQVAKEVLEITGAKSRLVFRPLPEDDPKMRRPDLARARKVLGWAPKVARIEGLKMTYEYFRSVAGKTK